VPQVFKRDGATVRIKGAKVCYNQSCPRRKKYKATAINRDENGARKIALIGIFALVSEDGNPLPPFNRSKKKKAGLYSITCITFDAVKFVY
jgi:hypothetical protein